MAKKAVDAAAPVALVLMSGEAIDKGIASIIKRSGQLSADIHKFAVQALLHAETHNDPRKLDRLYQGLHKANRPEAFKVWVEKFSPVRWNGDGKVGMLKATAKTFTPFNVQGADAEPYWTPQEIVSKPLTLDALKKMIAQMEKKLNKADEEGTIAEGENVVVMREYVARVKAAAEAQEVAA